MNLANPDERLKFQLSHLYPNAGKDLGFVVLTQERLDEMVQTAFVSGFEAGATFPESAFLGRHASEDQTECA